MRRRKIFQNGVHRAREQSQGYTPHKKLAESLQRMTVIRGHNNAKFPNLGFFLNRRLTLGRSESDFCDLLDELFHITNTDFFRKKSKLQVLFQSLRCQTFSFWNKGSRIEIIIFHFIRYQRVKQNDFSNLVKNVTTQSNGKSGFLNGLVLLSDDLVRIGWVTCGQPLALKIWNNKGFFFSFCAFFRTSSRVPWRARRSNGPGRTTDTFWPGRPGFWPAVLNRVWFRPVTDRTGVSCFVDASMIID